MENNSVKKFPIGGTHLPEEKELTTHTPIVEMPPPGEVTIPLKQHLGVPVEPAVSVGEKVRRGQVIGHRAQGLRALVHSSVSGEVVAFTDARLPDETTVPAVTIRTDPAASGDRVRLEPLNLEGLSQEEYRSAVVARVEEAGIVGLGGATFPTHIKLSTHDPIDTVIVNGAECEPYITVDDRLMQERADAVFRGLEIVRRTVGAKQGYVACEVNKPDALKRLREVARDYPHIAAQALDTRYPHGAEKHLVKAVLNREVPLRALPGSVGVLVNNVQTVCAIADAVDQGLPLSGRVVTVSGHGVREPKNLLIPLGASLGDAIAFCGGESVPDPAVVVGGPMTGMRITDYSIPVTKATSGIILLTEEEYAGSIHMACIRCGKCVEVCPMYLPPNRMTAYVNNDMIEEAVGAGLEACILCGACQFVCPSKRPLLEWIKHGKALAAARKKR
ncbi:MAG: electron transport complex subunit RsxC [Spirochaetaceae bacterium]|nr:MAG: electron transport complex subunit RsxC [Spirochaetaceae bacterium]